MFGIMRGEPMKLNPESLARASSHKPWRTIVIWIVALVVAGGLSSALLADTLTTDFDFTDEPESKRALNVLEERRGAALFSEFVVVTSDSATISDADYAAFVDQLKAAIVGVGPEKVVAQSVVSFQEVPQFATPDGTKAIISYSMADPDLDNASADVEDVAVAVEAVTPPTGFEALMFGQGTVNNDFVHLAEETLQKGEVFGIGIALIVLVIVIGALVAAVLPLILAIAAIVIAFGLAALIGQLFELSFFITNFITMIGLAVGIDYALFIVARYREERVRGFDKYEAIGRSGATANRAVFFSGTTVVLALLGMLLVPNTIFRSLGVGAIVVVILAMAASMTLLPAVLALLGDRVNKGRIRGEAALANVDKRGGMWDKITKTVMGRPVVWLTLATGVMVVLSLGFFSMKTGFSGVSTLPEDLGSRQAFDILEQDFGLGGASQPLEVVIKGDITPQVEVGRHAAR